MNAFTVDQQHVTRIRELISTLMAISTYTRLEVSPEDFPVWCAAMEVESFMAYRAKHNHTWVSTQHLYLGDRLVSVGCDTPPAPWVEFPSGEGDRRYMFRVATNEVESK